jgi:hypothetical protein
MTIPIEKGAVPTVGGGFFVGAFSLLGDFEGQSARRYENLSEKWIGLCRELLVELGTTFDYRWSNQLSHLRTKLTSAKGVGICTIFIKEQVAASMLLMTGKDELAEQAVIRMHQSSLRDSVPLIATGQDDGGFSRIASIVERPLMVVVPFPNKSVSEEDQDIVREISWHFAAAYFQEHR